MTTLLRYQPKQTLERRYYSSTSSSPTNEHYSSIKHNTASASDRNPHYQHLQALYNDKQRELQHVQHIISTDLNTIRTSETYNAIAEVFYNTQRNTLLQWEIEATNELHTLKEKLETYASHYMLHQHHKNGQYMNGSNSNGINHSALSDTSSSSSSSDDD